MLVLFGRQRAQGLNLLLECRLAERLQQFQIMSKLVVAYGRSLALQPFNLLPECRNVE